MSEEVKLHLRSAGAPNGIGEHWWSDSDAVVAVPEKLAHQLLNIRHGGYSIAETYKALPEKHVEPTGTLKPLTDPKPVGTLVSQLTEPIDSNPMETALDLVQPKGTRSRKA